MIGSQSQLWLLVCHIPAEPIAFSNSYFGAGDGPIIYSQVACGGWERDIDDCDKAEVLEFTCSRDKVAGVLCGYGEKICTINALFCIWKSITLEPEILVGIRFGALAQDEARMMLAVILLCS